MTRSTDGATLPYPEPNLSDDAVVLRPWEMTDLRCVEEASWDPHIPLGTTVPAEFSLDEGRAFIERQWSRQTDGEGLALAITDRASDDAVGQIVLLFRERPGVAGIGYWIIERARRRGFARRAVGLLSRWGLEESGLARVEALVEPDNIASQRVLEGVGFEREGLLRSYLSFGDVRADAFMYSLVTQDLG